MNHNLLMYYAVSFLAVAKAESFSKAAKNTGISKAQLSRHVSNLEKLLGIQLMNRTTRTLVLTEEGKQFYSDWEKIEENSIETISHLQQDFTHMQGTLKITAPIDFGIQFLPAIIQEFSKQYPKMNVILSLSNINENIIEQNFDIAIRIANQLPSSNLRSRTIFKFHRMICATPHYFKNQKKPHHPEELYKHYCITSVNYNKSNLYPQWSFLMNHKIKHYKLERFIEVDSLYAQRELIKSGVGIGRLPDYFIKEELKKGTLIELFPKLEKLISYVYVLYPDTISLPKRIRAFIDLLLQKLNKA
ncbi:hypothetical protein AYO45_01455 [Gammaproteobacteria bacterium SCGC AG-212-F23]|nr:hypothetical protein AYO45_01455 [Gammaproteobacteria bacterium SCGC AG-212-F23]